MKPAVTDIMLRILYEPLMMKSVSLSKKQRELVLFIGEYMSLTSSELAGLKDISMQDASTRMKCLFDKGYLGRDKTDALSGGIEFQYYLKLVNKNPLTR